MRKFTATLFLTIAVLIWSVGVSYAWQKPVELECIYISDNFAKFPQNESDDKKLLEELQKEKVKIYIDEFAINKYVNVDVDHPFLSQIINGNYFIARISESNIFLRNCESGRFEGRNCPILSQSNSGILINRYTGKTFGIWWDGNRTLFGSPITSGSPLPSASYLNQILGSKLNVRFEFKCQRRKKNVLKIYVIPNSFYIF